MNSPTRPSGYILPADNSFSIGKLTVSFDALAEAGRQIAKKFEELGNVLWMSATPAQRRRYIKRMVRETIAERRLQKGTSDV